jgi:hypothetical protein
MRTLTLDLGALEVETFTPYAAPWAARAAFADTDDADCDTESGPPDCETAGPDCETEICGEPTEDC